MVQPLSSGRRIISIVRLPLLATILAFGGGPSAFASEMADHVVVHKERHVLQLMKGSKVLREFPIALGGDPLGHKRQEGDQKTPEGRYLLDWRNSSSSYYKSIHISYPAPADVDAAAARGVDPGGMIMIHGQRNYFGWLSYLTQMFDWTDGCIAVTNEQMDEIWELVSDNTQIEIKP